MVQQQLAQVNEGAPENQEADPVIQEEQQNANEVEGGETNMDQQQN